ncbi:transposase [Ningiella sp. W23]|uniref:transposase n=1 Tax=Ningiella sp. W23 TaxID=3023715 RepID=UPI00375780A7
MASLAIERFKACPLFRNDVLLWDETHFRVIEIVDDTFFLFELDKNSGIPTQFKANELSLHFKNQEISMVDNHRYQPVLPLVKSEKFLSKIEERFNTIKGIVEHPEYLYSGIRGKLVSDAATLHGTSSASIYRALRDYWTFGQTMYALADRYHKSGGSGKRRVFKKKPGARNRYSLSNSAILDSEFREAMLVVIMQFHIALDKSLTYTHNRFVSLCKSLNPALTTQEIPSIHSLKFFFRTELSKHRVVRSKLSQKEYDKNHRPLHGTAAGSVYGPGARFEIDSTKGDMVAVRKDNRTEIVGRLTIYLVCDVYSRLVVGFYVGFQESHYRSASLALLNTFSDKTYLLKKHGISPKLTNQWGSTGRPQAILADKAELFGDQSTHLANTTGIRIENTASGRSEAKGCIEKLLDLIQMAYSGNLQGKSNKETLKKAGAIDGRLTAFLSRDEIEAIVVSQILAWNKYAVLDNYDCDPDFPDDLPLTPQNIWDWALKNRSGRLPPVDMQQMKTAILPKGFATVSAKGIKFNGLYYDSPELRESGWFERTKGTKRPSRLVVHFDPMIVNNVFAIDELQPHKVFSCALKQSSREYINYSFLEAKKRMDVKKKTSAIQHAESQEAKRLQEEYVLNIQRKAQKELNALKKCSHAGRIKAIPENRALEKEIERRELINKFSPVDIEIKDQLDDFSDPDIDDLFNLNDTEVEQNDTNGNDTFD